MGGSPRFPGSTQGERPSLLTMVDMVYSKQSESESEDCNDAGEDGGGGVCELWGGETGGSVRDDDGGIGGMD